MSDKIINPSLLKQIEVKDYALHKQPGVTVTDTNRDGKVTEADTFRQAATGKEIKGAEKSAVLTNVCGEMAPRDTYIAVTGKGLRALERNQASVAKDLSTKEGKKYDELRLGTSALRSYGGYDSALAACHYNRTGFQIDQGRTKTEIAVTYEDATGPYKDFVELRSGTDPKPLPPPPGYKGME